jgi:alkylation response protein AidB-like acyl-CoA dehydrogenase
MATPSLEMLLIAGRAIFLLFSFVLAAVAFTRWRRSAQAQTAQLLAHHEVVLHRLADLEARLDATNVSISRLGERIERPQQLASPTAAVSPGYQIAIRLARGGATPAELTSGCGLSTSEAELVHRLHSPHAKSGSRKAPAGPARAA